MQFCTNCGNKLTEGASFCSYCGSSTNASGKTVVTPGNDTYAEEQEFLDVTHRLLRWERKAWSICGKALTIFGIIYAALFLILAIVFAAIGEVGGEVFFGVFLFYALFLGGTFIGIGIVNQKAADKIPFYLDSLYSDFRYTYDRCGSIGMLVFSVLFGVVSLVFFIINFVRMKANRKLIESIIARQQNF